ncbi:MAG: DUF1566 domain-containing protein, partial [Deltaproteobacteria bacterium]|nr:DUF1566 domain-containing protein [Deltaproteobacteria bacterium]
MNRRRIAICFLVCSGLIASVVASRGYSQVDPGRYDVQADVVSDLATRLTWQRALPEGALTLALAIDYCSGLALAGRDDWRLPSLQEFQTIVDESRANPAINVDVFPGTPSVG